ncbi:MAG: putative selenate ABC transporter substrate-binding protein [Planctomycetes bacterium]|jgi:phosphonate transport system substrate-binding protein|nr:putative selenate ABC transporter substrate-binding protein [Planctomycetota bacterium]
MTMKHIPPRARLLATGLLLISVGACTPVDAGADTTLRYTAIPDHDARLLAERFAPLTAHLADTLGVAIEYVPMSDYQASVEAFKNGDIQLAWFGGLTGVQARAAVPGARAIAQGSVDPHFKSYFIAHGGTDLRPGKDFPDALAGRSFTFGSESSTSGRLMPEHFIRSATGQGPEDFFGTPNHYSGSHDKTARLVEAGTFEAGVINYRTYDSMVRDGRLDPQRCRVIWTTPAYADYNWTAHPDLEARFGPGFTDRLQSALVQLAQPQFLAALDRPEGLIPASNADFASLDELARGLGFVK